MEASFIKVPRIKIPVKQNFKVIRSKQYKLPHSQQETAVKQVRELVEAGIVSKSNSQFNSPLILVSKKPDVNDREDNKPQMRVVLDMRRINSEIVEPISINLPSLQEITAKLQGARIFSALDITCSFQQFKLDDNSSDLMSFTLDTLGPMKYNTLVFGLSVSPYFCCNFLNSIFLNLEHNFLYVDDVILYSNSFEQHLVEVEKFLARAETFNVRFKPRKAQLFKDQIIFLGHVISRDGIQINQANLDPLQNLERPKTPKGIKSFLGFMTYYSIFIPNFVSLISPLTNMLRKTEKFEWGP